MSNILIVLSAADKWTRTDGSTYDSGVWAEEFVVMHEKFAQAGHTIAIATPGGTAPTIDPHSMNPDVVGADNAADYGRYLASIKDVLAHPLMLAGIDMGRYDVVAIPGGHGPVEDLYKDPDMGRVLEAAEGAGKIIAPVCHGPAALLSAKDANGEWLFKGRKMTAATDQEETALGTARNAPWLLETRLKESGADYTHAGLWEAYIVRDGNLIAVRTPPQQVLLLMRSCRSLTNRSYKAAFSTRLSIRVHLKRTGGSDRLRPTRLFRRSPRASENRQFKAAKLSHLPIGIV